MNVLSVSNLTKRYGSFTAINDISFDLKEGEILGLLGQNGAGKTTTIQMLLGVLTPTSGEIYYFGKKFIEHKEEVLEQVNFSSTYAQFPWTLTVKENLIFFSYLYDIIDRKKRIQKIVDTFGLQDIFNKQIQDLSEGQKTRVYLAKAFINYPKILLLDEPTASLDPDAAKYIRNFLLHQRKEFQVSIVLTSHNMAEVEEVCDRIVFIDKGKIIANDTPVHLAKTIETAHVELLIDDGLEKMTGYCTGQKITFHLNGKYILLNLREKQISSFLQEIMHRGITYSEISIDKPTLEDYFLQVAEKRHTIHETT